MTGLGTIKRTLSSKAMAAEWDGKNHDEDLATTATDKSSAVIAGDRSAVNASFTPGPWSVSYHCGDFAIYDPKTQDGIAYLQADETPYIASSKTRAANARLIAAAPDMYEALTELLRFCDDANSYERENPHKYQPYISARAALAKAEGR